MKSIKELLLGKRRNPLDPHVFHQISLIALLAWIGLGADGLSSSSYGPEEAFLALGQYTHLALYLALATAGTIFIISASYSQLIELFPTGGGGYLVATKLLGPIPGLITGSALVVDYILTIAVSISSGVDAIFSFLPAGFLVYKLAIKIIMVFVLVILNLRGVKESVVILTPIFITFVITHILLIFYSIFGHIGELPLMLGDTVRETHQAIQTQGFFAVLFILLRAYSLGGGTYTGIEAVSNGMQILREPRVHTAKKTMLYMATSLAFTAGGILVGYLLMRVYPREGMTLNAVLISMVSQNWHWQGIPIGQLFFYITLLSEGLLLFVAAQSGFLAGPRVLANMAQDSWVPHRFAHLSDQLVTKNGVWLMGLAALMVIIGARGSVHVLVVLYSINVFLTFTSAQLGMCVHWWKVREEAPHWKKKIIVNGIGMGLTLFILIITTVVKFAEGGWVTLVITTSFIGVCLWIKAHYTQMGKYLRQLDNTLMSIPLPALATSAPMKDTKAPTAILLVNGYNGLGIHSLLAIIKAFGKHYQNIVFVSVGVLDTSKFKGVREVEHLKENTVNNLKKYVDMASRLGYYSEYHYSIGVDAIDEIEKICRETVAEFPNSIIYAGKLIFKEENYINRLLHNQVALTIQSRLLYSGIQVVVLPIRAL
jgi:amino acid transporter